MSKVTDPEISLCEMIVEICAQHLLTRGQWAEKLSSAITYKIESKEMQRSSAFFQKLCVSLSVLSRQHQNTVQFILMWFLFQKILCWCSDTNNDHLYILDQFKFSSGQFLMRILNKFTGEQFQKLHDTFISLNKDACWPECLENEQLFPSRLQMFLYIHRAHKDYYCIRDREPRMATLTSTQLLHVVVLSILRPQKYFTCHQLQLLRVQLCWVPLLDFTNGELEKNTGLGHNSWTHFCQTCQPCSQCHSVGHKLPDKQWTHISVFLQPSNTAF